MAHITHLATISDLLQLFNTGSSRHPLVAVIDFSRVKEHFSEALRVSADFYCVMFKHYHNDNIRYGRKVVDFQQGSLVCMAPHQVIEMDDADVNASMNGWGLFFHPDLIRNTSLNDKMKGYHFFSYEITEALHLSEKEQQALYDCIVKIDTELQENIDVHSQAIIVSNIELLLNYCTRFYGRQFITRKSSNHAVVAQVEKLLTEHFRQAAQTLPTVKYLAAQVHLSPSYLSDLLKKETGKNAQDHIHLHLIATAKDILLNSDKSIGEIAYGLGFEYPQYFNKLFKQKTGKTPVEFRNSN